MIDAIDSYFEVIQVGINIANQNRKVIGVMDAMDWPPKNVVMEAFYLLVLGARGLNGKSMWSSANPSFVHTLQWTWLIAGSDLTAGKIGRSRGDRYRTNLVMRDELVVATQQAWWATKQQYSVVGNTPSGIVLQAAPLTPSESIWWTPLVFLNRQDREAGLIYGAATVQVTDIESSLIQQ